MIRLESIFTAIPKNIVDRKNDAQIDRFARITGIEKTRRFRGDFMSVLLGACKAYGAHNIPDDVRAVIVVTQTAPRTSPCIATSLIEPLGLLPETMAFDVNQACAGWIYGIDIAQKLSLKTLVVCIDMLRFGETDTEKLIFSDAVSFTVVDYVMHKEQVRYFVSPNVEALHSSGDSMHMDGEKVFDFATTQVPRLIISYGTRAFDSLVLHQANKSMLRTIVMQSGFTGKVFGAIENIGNCSMNTIPATICTHGEHFTGKSALVCGFGAGFHAAITRVKLSHLPNKLNIVECDL